MQHGVVGAGGHGWAPARGWKCKCGWAPAQGAPSTLRAVQLREHVFWGCVGAQEVRRVLQRQLPQGVALLPKHVWLLEPPAPTINPIIWAAVGIAALTVMLTVSKQLRSGVGESQARGPEALAHTRALLRAALEDFAACQGPSHAFYVGPDHPFLSCRNSGRLESVLV